MHSVAGTMTRVNTVASLMKRFLGGRDNSRDDSRPSSADPGANSNMRLGTSASSASIAGKYPIQGSMKIADQVIEEVDEQMTITSMRAQEARPTAQSIFSHVPPQHSDPMDVPGRVPSYMRAHSAFVHGGTEPLLFPPGGVDALLSTSAPNPAKFQHSNIPSGGDFDTKGFGSQETEKSMNIEELDSTPMPDDDFEKLRQARELERIERQKQKLARSISNQQGLVTQFEAQDILLEALAKGGSGANSPTSDRKSGIEFDSNL